jgi:hypothetical protein
LAGGSPAGGGGAWAAAGQTSANAIATAAKPRRKEIRSAHVGVIGTRSIAATIAEVRFADKPPPAWMPGYSINFACAAQAAV